MRLKKIGFVYLVIVLVSSNLSFAQSKSITIGVIAPLSGECSDIGDDMLNGARAAIDMFTSKNLPSDIILNLVVEDSACSDRQSIVAANKLLSNNPVGVVGGYCPLGTYNASIILAENNVPIISPSTYQKDIISSDNVFSVAESYDMADNLLYLLSRKINNDDPPTIYNDFTENRFINSSTHFVTKEFLTIIEYEHIFHNLTYSINTIFKENIRVYLAYDANKNSICASTKGFPCDTFDKKHKKYIISTDIDNTTEQYDTFLHYYSSYSGNLNPSEISIYTYDATIALLTAIENTNYSQDPLVVREAIPSVRFNGVSKHIKFNRIGLSSTGLNIFEISASNLSIFPDACNGCTCPTDDTDGDCPENCDCN